METREFSQIGRKGTVYQCVDEVARKGVDANGHLLEVLKDKLLDAGVIDLYEAVDLGLPSGTKWANMNIGAREKATEYGLYFSWGNVVGHKADEGYSFDSGTYSTTPGASLTADIPVGDTYDAARAIMGGAWKMPTRVQFMELLDTYHVINEWVENYEGSGVNGRLFTSVYNGGSIFLPAAGYGCEALFYDVGSEGFYWSSSIDTGSTRSARYLHLNRFGRIMYADFRANGFPIRAVQ